ncbi:MAG: UDP-N-acetylmuramoyl-L-alanyl-D-glutamate--2,6-diaminopimelate ligase [Polyangiales bacterium]|jgi:UDP-N-acetylmuramoyl-L-alanyl-D-glutamate--2,6-diaminopimelate ligase
MKRPPNEPLFFARFEAARTKLRTVAVTGTNGKTSTTTFIGSVVEQHGPAATVTTLGAWVDGSRVPGKGTAEFLATVEGAVKAGVEILAVEMTSKALLGGLASRWPAEVAVFTNLTHDHLDLHETAEAYLAAKAQLFLALPKGGTAVLNADDPACELLAEVVPSHARILWYGSKPCDLQIVSTQANGTGQLMTLAPSQELRAHGIASSITLRVGGGFQAFNAAAAALASFALGLDAGAIRVGLGAVGKIDGRFEVVQQDPCVIVDFAHTPDALRHVLASARALAGEHARLHCVFGCGGDRDRSKRAPMGALVDELADVVWLTSDNPRSEDPAQIAADVLAGSLGRAEWHRELMRQRAIIRALENASSSDVVVIAGKGHEATQEIAGTRHPFVDADEVRRYFRGEA